MSGLTIAISAGLAVAGAGTAAYANHQALQKQDSAAAQGIQRQAALQKQAENDAQTNIKQAQQNQQNVDKNQSTLQDEYTAALQRNNGAAQSTQGALPGASKKYAEGVQSAIQANQQYGTKLAGTAAAVGAPTLTNLQTQEGLGDTATKLGMLNDQSNQQNQLTQMQVNSIAANPWMLAAGAALSGASKGYGSYAGYNGAQVAQAPPSAAVVGNDPLGYLGSYTRS